MPGRPRVIVRQYVLEQAQRALMPVARFASIRCAFMQNNMAQSVSLLSGVGKPGLPDLRIGIGKAAGRRSSVSRVRGGLLPYSGSIAMVVLATALAYLANNAAGLLGYTVDPASLSAIYLPAVTICALKFGRRPALLASAASVLAWDYLFTEPYYHLDIASARDVLALILFGGAAILVSDLMTQIRAQTAMISNQAETTAALLTFYRNITAASSEDRLNAAIVDQIGSILGCEVLLLRQGPSGLEPAAGSADIRISPEEMQASEAVWADRREISVAASQGTTTLLIPLATSHSTRALLAARRPAGAEFSESERSLLAGLANQALAAIDRLMLANELQRVHSQAEAERLRNALLTSISHDLRTPLSTILGAHSMLADPNRDCDVGTRRELVSMAQTEAQRLDRFIGNLLDMTRLKSGGLNVKRMPVDLAEIVDAVLERMRAAAQSHTVEVTIAPDCRWSWPTS